MNWSRILFRCGGIPALLFAAGHLIGHFSWKNTAPVNGAEITLLDMMYNYRRHTFGAFRSVGEFYDGMSIALSVLLATVALLAFTVPPEKRTAWILGGAMTALFGLSLMYWFSAPTIMCSLAAGCFVGSALRSR